MSAKKITFRILITCLILLLGLVIAYQYAKKQDFFFPEINTLIEESTGFKLGTSDPVEAALFPNPGISLSSFTLSNPGSLMGEDIFKAERLSISLDWASLFRLKPVVDIDAESADINLNLDEAGEANWLARKRSDESGGLPFEIDKIQVSNIRFRFKNYQANEVFGLDIDHLHTDVSSGQASAYIDSAGQLKDQRFLAQGEVHFQRASRTLELDLNVSVVHASIISVAKVEVPSIADWIKNRKAPFPVQGTLKGSISITESLPYGELRFQAEATTLGDLSFLRNSLTFLKPELGPLYAAGNLQFRGSDLDLVKLRANLKREEGDIKVRGELQNLLSTLLMNLEIDAQVNRLDPFLTPKFIAAQSAFPLPRLEAIKFTSSLGSGEPGLEISDIEAQFRHRSLDAEIKGSILIGSGPMISNLDVSGRAENSNDLLDLFGIKYALPTGLEPIDVAAHVSGENGSYQVEGGTFSAHENQIKGIVSGTLHTSGEKLRFDLASQFNIDDLALISSVFPSNVEPFLQAAGAQAKGEIAGSTNDFSINNAEIKIFRDQRQLYLRGKLAQLPNKPSPDFSFQFVAGEPVALAKYFPRLGDMYLNGPMDLSGTVRSVNGRLLIQQIQLQAQQTDIAGDIIIDTNESPPRITANFSSRNFITQLFEPETKEVPNGEVQAGPEAEVEEEPGRQTEPKKVLSAKELGEAFKAYTSSILVETDWIEKLNLSFSYTADKALIRNYEVEKLSLIVSARHKVFRLVKYEFSLKGRPISLRGMINAIPALPLYELEGALQGDTLEALLNIEGGLVEGGEIGGGLNLKSAGNSLGELIENLQGQITVHMGPLKIKSGILNTVSSGIFSTMLNGIISKKEDDPSSDYQCGVLGVDVSDGVARFDRALTLQAEDYNLAGDGSIDLNTGAIDIKVSPKARKGLGLSISTIIGGFKVQGHMATPKLGVSGGSLVSAAILGYALVPAVTAGAMTNPVTATVVATGYLAKGLFDRITANAYTCENIQNRIQHKRAQKQASSGASAPSREF